MKPIELTPKTAKMDWIKCSDMLPEFDGTYLTVCIEDGVAMHESDAELMQFEAEEWVLTWGDDEPTHWLRIELPLPKDN